MHKQGDGKRPLFEPAAGNGMLNRRVFLEGAFVAAAAGAAVTPARAEPLVVPRWMKEPGTALIAYGQPSGFEGKVVRSVPPPPNPATVGIGTARTPLQLLDGMITPNGLHFDRSHSGTPGIDPDQHRLLIHGLVKRPLLFTLEALARYPMESRIAFIECAGNSGALNSAQAQPGNAQAIHGLLSCAEWTGVRLATLLEEAGVEAGAQWVVAEGADAAAMSRSVPLAKCMDDALDYVRRAMPYNETKALTNDELYAVAAYILHLNGVVGADDVLDAQSLPKVKMPNRDGFIPFPR
jgi:sulfane dehydrogenase subunit SoxC